MYELGQAMCQLNASLRKDYTLCGTYRQFDVRIAYTINKLKLLLLGGFRLDM